MPAAELISPPPITQCRAAMPAEDPGRFRAREPGRDGTRTARNRRGASRDPSREARQTGNGGISRGDLRGEKISGLELDAPRLHAGDKGRVVLRGYEPVGAAPGLRERPAIDAGDMNAENFSDDGGASTLGGDLRCDIFHSQTVARFEPPRQCLSVRISRHTKNTLAGI